MTDIDHHLGFPAPSDTQRLMHSMQRLMKIGLYYPEGHSVLDQAAGTFRHDLKRVARDKPSICFFLRNGRLFLEEIEIQQTNDFIREFQQTLATLGIDAVEIDRAIEEREIILFFQRLLQERASLRAAQNFQQVQFHDLPLTVRVTQREFLTASSGEAMATGDSVSGTTSQPNLDQFLEWLQKKGVGGNHLARCRAVLETLAGRELSQQQVKPGLSHVDWGDVERLLLQVTREESDDGVGEKVSSSVSSLNSLASILEALEKHTSAKRSKEAINLLISVVKNQKAVEEGENSEKPSAGSSRKTDSPLIPVAWLNDFIRSHHPGKHEIHKLFGVDRREELGLLLLQLERELPLEIEARIALALRNILNSPLATTEWELLVVGTRHYLRRLSNVRMDHILKIILPPLRRSQPASSIALLNEVLTECSLQELRKIWPQAVNEIIRLGSRRAPEAYRQLVDKVVHLPVVDQVDCLPLLQEQDGFLDKSVAPDVFSQLPTSSYPLFGLLLTTSLQSQLVTRILQDFTLHPPEKVIEAVVPFLDKNNPLHTQFLRTYLQQAKPYAPVSQDAAGLAGRILCEALETVPRERRSEAFMTKAISAIGDLHVESGRPMLDEIVSEKKWLVFYEWPASCRQAATASLKKVKRQRPAGRRSL